MMAFVGVVYGMIAGSAYLSRRLMRSKYDRATVANIVVDGAGAATIRVLATFTGVRGLPWWYAVATNNAKPLLVIERDAVRIRVIRERRRPFPNIASVDVRQATGTVNLDLRFRGSPLTFSANLGKCPLPRTFCRFSRHTFR
ncbi:hypothetical protein [Sphingomonas gellani]|nr:hypothetical protein [Sphingomonas gellani]